MSGKMLTTSSNSTRKWTIFARYSACLNKTSTSTSSWSIGSTGSKSFLSGSKSSAYRAGETKERSDRDTHLVIWRICSMRHLQHTLGPISKLGLGHAKTRWVWSNWYTRSMRLSWTCPKKARSKSRLSLIASCLNMVLSVAPISLRWRKLSVKGWNKIGLVSCSRTSWSKWEARSTQMKPMAQSVTPFRTIRWIGTIAWSIASSKLRQTRSTTSRSWALSYAEMTKKRWWSSNNSSIS